MENTVTCAIVASSGLVGFTLLGLIKGFIYSKPPGRRLVREIKRKEKNKKFN